MQIEQKLFDKVYTKRELQNFMTIKYSQEHEQPSQDLFFSMNIWMDPSNPDIQHSYFLNTNARGCNLVIIEDEHV